jgi:transcriptional regulator with XRE-family HTH domain
MVTKASPNDPLASHVAWRHLNPLQIWRRANRCSIRDCAALLDYGTGAIQNWENGNTQPPEEVRPRIARLLGITHGDLVAAWDAWMDKKPSL